LVSCARVKLRLPKAGCSCRMLYTGQNGLNCFVVGTPEEVGLMSLLTAAGSVWCTYAP